LGALGKLFLIIKLYLRELSKVGEEKKKKEELKIEKVRLRKADAWITLKSQVDSVSMFTCSLTISKPPVPSCCVLSNGANRVYLLHWDQRENKHFRIPIRPLEKNA
jgi:hypothetical protein